VFPKEEELKGKEAKGEGEREEKERRKRGEREEKKGLTGTKLVSTGPATKASCPATAFKNSILVLGPIT